MGFFETYKGMCLVPAHPEMISYLVGCAELRIDLPDRTTRYPSTPEASAMARTAQTTIKG